MELWLIIREFCVIFSCFIDWDQFVGMYPGELHRRHSVDILGLCGKINSAMSVNSQVGTDSVEYHCRNWSNQDSFSMGP